ncbi:MAG: YidC/Oxa1 family insertase periplasmic-domain containing protein [Thermoguttaceae bacterium]|nr:YidC/Oxa1 family insertase periplasmic-domain containing protein [Thermoguttaceae bacterium]
MTTPKLRPLQPPPVPKSLRKGLERQEPPKSNFFFTLMMIFLIVWTFQVFTAKPPQEPMQVDRSAPTTGEAPTLTDEAKSALPTEFVAAAEKAEREGVAPEFYTLGSLDPKSPYRMLATFSNRGAALARVELNEEQYVDNADSTGYLGQIVADETLVDLEARLGLPGVAAQVVGVGTPAASAGLKVGDRIVGVVRDGAEPVAVDSFEALRDALLATKPGEKIALEIYRGEELDKNEAYRALKAEAAAALRSLTTVPFFAESASLEPSDAASSEEPKTENAENVEVASTEPSEATEKTDGATTFDVAGLTKETLEVALQKAPLSVIRPSGLVNDYADYVNLAGLQGAVRDDRGALELLTLDEAKRKANDDPASFLTTLATVDGERLADWAPNLEASTASAPRPTALANELPGVEMRDGYWEFVPEESSENAVVFRQNLLERRLQIVKKYALEPEEGVVADKRKATDGRGYHLTLSVEIRNVDAKPRSVSYLLDGPTGLALEGAWFSAGRKTGPGWGAYGLRDLVVSENNGKKFDVIKCWDVAEDKARRGDETDLDFLGVDGQYFQCSAIPSGDAAANRFAYAPIRVGTRTKERPNFADVSFRLRSAELQLAPRGAAGDSVAHTFEIFAGPKRPDVLATYDLSETLVYGWFWFVSIPLLWILHFFHDYLVFNYGIAIVMLTILVRLCLFPLSRKQVASSLKMQKLQPELTAMREKYKDKPQEMMTAQQALFKRHGVNPLSGCLPIFIQMPIFIGLYKALSLDVNLYGAPLFSRGVRWCSNLAAPDMAFDWSGFWNSIGWEGFNMAGQGFGAMFCLGPYLNILPVITIALFLIQQKILMPPVIGDDEQAQQQRMMRRMMNFMMVFMGFMFFKVPSGLCIYFIVSSLWGLLERKMLPKADLELNPGTAPVVEAATGTAAVAGVESKRERRKAFVATGRTYEKYAVRRDAKGRRISAKPAEAPKSKFRAWWDEIVEKAQEQQRLAKAEEEDRSVFSGKKRRRG